MLKHCLLQTVFKRKTPSFLQYWVHLYLTLYVILLLWKITGIVFMYSVYCLTLINSNFSYMFFLCFYSLFRCYLYYTSLKFKDTALCYNVFLCDLPQLPAHSLRYKWSSNNKVPCAFLTVSWDAWCWVDSAVSLHQLPSSGVESMSHYHFNFFADEKYFYY